VLGVRGFGIVGAEESREIRTLLGGIIRRPAAQARA
jgi:hypothetical protein